MTKTILLTLMLCTVAGAQTTIIASGGGSSAGLGSRAGASIGLDLDARHGKIELVSRLTVDLAHKVGSIRGGTFSERALVRYGGDRVRFGGGLGIFHVSGAFGSRAAFAPLVHVAFVAAHSDVHGVLLYATVRPYEWGTNYTAEHRTRGIETGAELTQRRGRLIFRGAAGVEALSYHNLDNLGQRAGAYVFARVGVGIRF